MRFYCSAARETYTKPGNAPGHELRPLSFRHKPIQGASLGFEFYGYATYHGLVRAGNPIIQAVISTMLDTQDYFFLAINPDQTVTAFRSQFDAPDLAGLRTNQEQFGEDSCSSEQYESAAKTFTKNPDPPGNLLVPVS